MTYTLKTKPTRIEINLILIKPKLKSILKLNLISLLPLHNSCLSLSLCILAAFTLYHENTVVKKWMHLTIKRSCPLVLFLNFKYHLLCVILKVNGLSFKIVCLSYNPLNYFYQSQTLKPSAPRTYDEPLSILHKRLHRAPRCIHLLASYILSWQAL